MFFTSSHDTHSISVTDLIEPAADAALVTQSHRALGPLECEVCHATSPGGVAVGVVVIEIAQRHPWILWVLADGFSESDYDSKCPIAVCPEHQSHPAVREMRFDAALLAAHAVESEPVVAIATPEPRSDSLAAVTGSGSCNSCARPEDAPHTADCSVALAQDAADNGHDYDPEDESCKTCGARSEDLDRTCGTGPLCQEKTCHHFGRTMIDGSDGAWTCPPVLGIVCHKGHPMQAALTDDAEIGSDGSVTHNPGSVDRIFCAADCEDVPEEIIDAAARIFDNDGADLPDEDEDAA